MQIHRKIDYSMVKKEFDERGYILLSTEYKNNSSYLEYICPKHKDKGALKITFANFTKGRGCPYCANRVRKTQEEYEQELAKVKPFIKVIGAYINLKTKIEHECLICGNKWNVCPDNMLHAPNGCPHCGKRELLNQEILINKVKEIDESIEVVSDYIDTQTKIDFRCKRCGEVWQAKPNNILNGRGCPICKAPLSKGEKAIEKLLKEKGAKYIREFIFKDCKDITYLPFDFYLPDHNICIEYDGQQHYAPVRFGGISQERAEANFAKVRFHDRLKTEYCQRNGIKLTRIPYYDFNKIKEIVSLI